MTAREWVVARDQRPLPMNAYRRLHHHARAEYDEDWRAAFHVYARQAKVPRGLEAIEVEVHQACAKPPLPDPGASYPTVKAALDGIVDAGVIRDDTGEFVRLLAFFPPVRGPVDRLLLVLREASHNPDR